MSGQSGSPGKLNLQVPPIKNSDGLDHQHGTLHKNDSMHSKGLYQVTEKNSENASVFQPSQNLHKVKSL